MYRIFCPLVLLSILHHSCFSMDSQLGFIENNGQVKGFDGINHSEVKYMHMNGAIKIFIRTDGLTYQFEKYQFKRVFNVDFNKTSDSIDSLSLIETYRMDMTFKNINLSTEIIAEGKSEDYINFIEEKFIKSYFYKRIIYKNIYPKIDWVLYITQDGRLEYDFILHPGADYRDIRMKYNGSEKIELDKFGNLLIRNRLGDIRENAPSTFQERKLVRSKFNLKENIVGFDLSAFNNKQELTIDPKIEWSTYYGGSQFDGFGSIDQINNGAIYAAGQSFSSTNIAYLGSQMNIPSGKNSSAFLVKFNSNGSRLWGTYYGGNIGIRKIKIDSKSNVICIASANTSSLIYPSNAHQASYGGGLNDGVIIKFDSSGNRVWATFLGGNNNDGISDLAIDSLNNIYVLGGTSSPNNIYQNGVFDQLIKYPNRMNPSNTDSANEFIAKFNENGARIWGTYFGATPVGNNRMHIDRLQRVFIASNYADTTFLFRNAASSDYCSSNYRNYIARLDTAGHIQKIKCLNKDTMLQWLGLKSDGEGNIYLSSQTTVPNLAVNGFQMSIKGQTDAFLLKLDSNFITIWSTYYGDTFSEQFSELSIDKKNNIYAIGETNSRSGIAYRGVSNILGGISDGLIVKFKKNGSRIFATYLGGSNYDALLYGTVNSLNELYVGGQTNSTNSLAINAHQNTLGGGMDAFLAKLSCNRDTTLYDTICRGDTLVFNGIPRTQAGDYLDTLETWDICDSFITMKLTVSRRDTTHLFDTFCQGTSKTWNGNQLTTSGVYLDTLINIEHCDSFLTYHLTVRPLDTTFLYDTSCGNTPRVWNGIDLTASGTYLDTLSNQYGCDSFLFYHYIPKPIHHSTDTAKICRGTTYHGHTTSGTYSDTLRSAFGCDSVVSLYLTVLDTSSTAWTASICSGSYYLFQGDTLRSAGHYRDTLKNRNGCDSFLTLTLLMKSSASKIIFDTLCPEKTYKFGIKILSKSGIYRDSLKAKNGCDSIVTLHLFVRPKQQLKLIDTNYRLIATSGFTQYRWYRNGQLLTLPNLNLCPATTSGIYKVEVTEKNGCRYFSDSMVIERSSIATMTDGDFFDVFPNPTREHLYIQIGSHLDEEFSITIYTIEGKKINAPLHRITSSLYFISTTGLSSGDYLIELKTGKKIVTKKWMVE